MDAVTLRPGRSLAARLLSSTVLLALGVVAATVAGSVVSGTLVGIRGFDTAREEWVKGSKSFSSEEDLHLRATAYDLTSAAVEGETLPPHALQAARRLQ